MKIENAEIPRFAQRSAKDHRSAAGYLRAGIFRDLPPRNACRDAVLSLAAW
jgi:hypothetical protein